MRMTQFQLGTVRIRTGWSEGQIRQSGYPLADDPHIPSCCFNFIISALFIIECARSGNVDTWQYISVLNVRIIIIIFMAIEKIILISLTK